MQGQFTTMDLLINALTTISTTTNDGLRKQAEDQLFQLKQSPEFSIVAIHCMRMIACCGHLSVVDFLPENPSLDANLRSAVAIELKNYIKKHWSSVSLVIFVLYLFLTALDGCDQSRTQN